MVLLIRALFDQIDEVAHLKSKGHKANISFEMLREIASVIRELEPEDFNLYQEFLLKLAPAVSLAQVSRPSSEYATIK